MTSSSGTWRSKSQKIAKARAQGRTRRRLAPNERPTAGSEGSASLIPASLRGMPGPRKPEESRGSEGAPERAENGLRSYIVCP